MAMREFRTAAKQADEADFEPLVFDIDGRETVFNQPTSGQLAITVAGASDIATDQERAATAINFFFSLLEDKDVKHYKRRLFDRDDPFGIEEISDIIEAIFEEWSARPTMSPSASSSSQRTGGQRSTRARRSTE